MCVSLSLFWSRKAVEPAPAQTPLYDSSSRMKQVGHLQTRWGLVRFLGSSARVTRLLSGRLGVSAWACPEYVPAATRPLLLSGLHQRASAECVQYRRRRSTDGAAVLATDSDGSPPGCLIIGSTGQVVIHVYERWH